MACTFSRYRSRPTKLLYYITCIYKQSNIQDFSTPSSFLAIFALLVFHRHLFHCFYRSLQFSYSWPNSILYLFSISRVDGLLVSLFEFCQFLLGGCPVVGCVNGLLFGFFGGYLEFVFCCCIAVAVVSSQQDKWLGQRPTVLVVLPLARLRRFWQRKCGEDVVG